MTMPLADVRIIELGHVIAGPLAAALLSDFGADYWLERDRNGGFPHELHRAMPWDHRSHDHDAGHR